MRPHSHFLPRQYLSLSSQGPRVRSSRWVLSYECRVDVDFVEELPFARRRLATGAASSEAKLGLCASGAEDRRRKGNFDPANVAAGRRRLLAAGNRGCRETGQFSTDRRQKTAVEPLLHLAAKRPLASRL